MSDLPTDEYLIYRITMDVSIPVQRVDKNGEPEEVVCALDYVRMDWDCTEASLLGWTEERLIVGIKAGKTLIRVCGNIRCSRDKRLFEARRKNQVYCSPECRNQHNVNTHREKQEKAG